MARLPPAGPDERRTRVCAEREHHFAVDHDEGERRIGAGRLQAKPRLAKATASGVPIRTEHWASPAARSILVRVANDAHENHRLPFRWNMASPGLLKRLGQRPPAPLQREMQDALIELTGRVLREAGDAELVFVGRSPESLFDLASGALAETEWRDRPRLLQLSLRNDRPPSAGEEGAVSPEQADALRADFAAHGLLPEQILARRRPVAFIDIVDTGRSFGDLVEWLRYWSGESTVWDDLRTRLRFVAIVTDGQAPEWEPSHSSWPAEHALSDAVRRIFIASATWYFLGVRQAKTTYSHRSRWWTRRWHRDEPPDDPGALAAAGAAWSIYRIGCRSRGALAKVLERPPRPEPWRAALIRELFLSA